MPGRCCVPNCHGNYDGKEKVSVFQFPTDKDRIRLWLSKIPRDNFVPNSRTVVCEKHFDKSFILRFDSMKRPDGSVLTVKRGRPKLTKDAYPSFFPNCPPYLSSDIPAKRKAPDDRRQEMMERDDDSFAEWLEADKIADFQQFSEIFQNRITNVWISRLWDSDNNDTASSSYSPCQCWSIYRLNDSADTNSDPHLVCTLKIFSDLHVEVFIEKIGKLPNSATAWIFGNSTTPVLKTWSQFDTLVSHFANKDIVQNYSFKDQLNIHITAIQKICDAESMEDVSKSKITRYIFLSEQMLLVESTTKRYSSKTLLWAFQLFAKTPRSYTLLRSFLTLPHPSYLRKMCSIFQIRSGLDETNVHVEYLRQKCFKMNEKDRDIILMLDEIHISNKLSYKAGRLEGAAMNCPVMEANSAQVFMISSILSKSKDVVAIVPVKNIDASWLHQLIIQVLSILHQSGFHVICLISDNNRINRNAFTIMCGGILKPSIPNPVAPNERLFFLFDTVHLFKCIRNNWLGQKDIEKTFMFPPFPSTYSTSTPPFPSTSTDSTSIPSIMRSSFSHLKKLHKEESSSIIKLAPCLNTKCLNPTATEKQNVNLMMRVFDNRNVIALQHFESIWNIDTSGTRAFISHIVQLWSMVNVKHPLKGLRLRDDNCKPVTSTSDNIMCFINSFTKWLEEWKKLCLKPREGCLSKDTMDALYHTLLTFVELVDYLLNVKKFDYILLGKFQTDDLEFRFCQYRQMSGSNYHVSVQQVLEGEKKLKLLSVLKLSSASNGLVKLKDITQPMEEIASIASAAVSEEYSSYFIPLVCEECDETEVSVEQLKVLVFIAGYCVRKIVSETDCETCRSDLHTNQRLSVDVCEETSSYIMALDRGGLMWPTDFIVQTIVQCFKVFQVIIKENDREEKFLSCGIQRQLLTNLSMERLSALGFCDRRCEECGLVSKEVIWKCCRPAVNIFLNNYSKLFSDKLLTANQARKLKTYTKRM